MRVVARGYLFSVAAVGCDGLGAFRAGTVEPALRDLVEALQYGGKTGVVGNRL